MLDIKNQDLDKANKGLGISFTILVFAANFILICLTIRKGGFFYTPRNLTIISLAVGDIFLALFGLVILTRIQFDEYDDLNLSCSTRVSYIVYVNFVIHFVYASGLIILAAELVHRFKTSQITVNSTANIMTSVAISAIPWILGLIIVLPLALENEDPCYVDMSNERIRVTLGISVIVPAVLAVLVYLGVMTTSLSPASITTATVLEQSQNQRNIESLPGQYVMNDYSQFPVAHTVGSQLPVNTVSGSPHISASETMDTHNPNLEGQAYPAPITHYPLHHYPAYPQASPENPLPQYAPQQLITQYNNMIQSSGQLQNTTDPALSNPSREKKILCLISIVHLLCVVPSAVFTLGMYVGNYNPNSTDTILDWSFFWLSVFRSFITPIMFSYMIN